MSQRKFKRATAKETRQSKPSPQPQPGHQPIGQAMVWYREEHWAQLKELFEDGDLLPESYGDWLVRAEQMKQEAEAAGDAVIKVFIDPETFPDWCASKEIPMNSEARSQLAIEVAQAQSFSL